MDEKKIMQSATGRIVKAFGNLVHVRFEGDVRQGEVCYIILGNQKFSGEVIEIAGDEAKVQVFEDTRGICLGTPVEFSGRLLEAELGPGLLTSIFDGLQNPLEKIADKAGLFLKRGVYIAPLDRFGKWDFTPIAKVNDKVFAGSFLGEVPEGIFKHKIMVPFALTGEYKVVSIVERNSYSLDDVIATIKDEKGTLHEVTMVQRWPVKKGLRRGEKRLPQKMMTTGLRIIDTQLPVMKGGTFCSPGPFGAGKTVLQHHLSKYADVDIVVVAACGERAGEVVELLREFPLLNDARTNKPLIERTVIICNTSSMPVAAREASVYMGVTIAEYYRQMGLDVLVLADSTSRWAQAMREVSGRLEEIPGEEAFPAYLASRIASFYERAGVVKIRENLFGSLTIGGTVSPAGGNFEEPVTQATLSVVGAFLGLSRERSYARRYPAIDPLISWTKYLEKIGGSLNEKMENWTERVKRALDFLQRGDEIGKRMEVVGEEGTAIEDMVVYLKAELYEICYLQQNAFDKEDAYSSLDRQVELFQLIQDIFDASFAFDTRDDARAFFLNLHSEIKNMNFMPCPSEKYRQVYNEIQTRIMVRK